MAADCPLCRLEDADPLVVHAGRSAVVLVSGEGVTRGHVVVIARDHVEHLAALDEPAAAGFLAAWRGAERAVLEAGYGERVIAVKLGLAVPHLHVHLYPIARATTRGEVVAMIERRVRDETVVAGVREVAAALRARWPRG